MTHKLEHSRLYELPPVPVCATLTTPLINAGGKDVYRIHPHTVQQTARLQFTNLLIEYNSRG